MFKALKELFTPGNKDLRQRIYFTVAALTVFILGISIRVPGTENLTENLGFLELINTIGGGALRNFSIFALGVMPYITASIIVQLLQMDIVPYFTELRKQGHTGRQKINQITQKGLGNGVSLIIMAGIIARLPQMFIDAFTSLVTFSGTTQVITLGIVKFIIFIIVYFAIVIGMIFVQESERRIPIQYANKSTNAYGASQSFMPIKINTAGVIPVIFASSLLSIPSIIAQVVQNETFTVIVQKYLNYTTPVGFTLYVVFIFFFAYFYTFIQLKPEEFAKNLQDNGGYIPGIRPGEETKQYVNKILSRLTVLGATFLSIISGLPILFSKLTSLPTSVSIGGTGLLIVVGVALETYKQLESSLLTRSYKRGYSRR